MTWPGGVGQVGRVGQVRRRTGLSLSDMLAAHTPSLAGSTCGMARDPQTGEFRYWLDGAEVTAAEWFGNYTASGTTSRTYFDAFGVLRNDLSVDDPRFSYEDGQWWYVNEGSSTNLLAYSEAFDNVVWQKFGGATVTPNSTAAPDDTISADLVLQGGSGDYIIRNVIGSVSTSYTNTIFAKDDIADRVLCYIGGGGIGGVDGGVRFSLSDGSFIATKGAAPASYSSFSAAQDFFNFSISFTTGGSDASFDLTTQFTDNSNSLANQSGYLWGVQLEAKPYPTHYIPTAASPVVRPAEVFRMPAALIAAQQGAGITLLIGGKAEGVVNGQRLIGGNGSTAPAHIVSNTVAACVDDSANTLQATAGSGGFTTGFRIAFSGTASNRSLVMNGGTVETEAIGVGDLTNGFIGSQAGSSNFSDCLWDYIAFLPEELTGTALQDKAPAP